MYVAYCLHSKFLSFGVYVSSGTLMLIQCVILY